MAHDYPASLLTVRRSLVTVHATLVMRDRLYSALSVPDEIDLTALEKNNLF